MGACVASGWGRGRGARSGIVLTVAVLLLAGCSTDDGGTSPTPTPEATVASTAAATGPSVALGPIAWTTALDPATGAPEDDLEVVAYDAPAIIAAIETGPLPAGTELTGEWAMNGVAVPGGPVIVRTDQAREAGWVNFELTLNEGKTWPPGVLELTVTAPGGEKVSGSIRIQVN